MDFYASSQASLVMNALLVMIIVESGASPYFTKNTSVEAALGLPFPFIRQMVGSFVPAHVPVQTIVTEHWV